MAATVRPALFSCHVQHDGSTVVVTPHGELDLSAVETFKLLVDDVLASGARSIVADLSALTFLDSSGLRCLLALAAWARRDGFQLELVPGPASVMRIFELTATREVLPFRSAP
jgi:anti-anti-sigma factor